MEKEATYKDLKIGVYAIAAGEPNEFIDRWLNSMKGADYIWVLITKLNDPNYAYFKEKQKLDEFKNKLFVEEKEIKPWRFDVARNESYKIIDKYCDGLICTDIDEVLIEDFWDDFRKAIFEHPRFERIYYRYAWGHDGETGQPTTCFWYDKTMHPNGGYRWDYPVHECIWCPEVEKYGWEGQYFMDNGKIYLHHYPDKSKSRKSYFDLLKMRSEENERDLYGYYYLAREYTFSGDWFHCLKALQPLYNLLAMNPKIPEAAKTLQDVYMYPATCIMIGQAYLYTGNNDDAEQYFVKAINNYPSLVDGYINLAQLYAYSNRPQKAREVLNLAKANAKEQIDWRIRLYYWRPWKWLQIQADALSWEGKYEEALEIFKEAEKDIKTADDKAYAEAERFYHDLEFVKNKIAEKEKAQAEAEVVTEAEEAPVTEAAGEEKEEKAE